MTQAFTIDVPVTREDADSDGKVNWFHPRFGWTQGDWRYPIYTDCTHWARLPERPLPVDTDAVITANFDVWIRSFPDAFDAGAVALLKTGFRAGWQTHSRRLP